MKSQRSDWLTKIVGCLGALVSSLSFMAATTAAQQRAPAPPSNRDAFGEMRERRQREAALRSVENRPTTATTDQRSIEAAVEQVKQDFKRIQILRNEIVRSLLDQRPLDYKMISEKSGEINKRANRLKTQLVAYKPAEDEKQQNAQVEFGNDRMQDALVTLCKRIESFIESPIFKVPGVVDLQESAKAARNLQSIIELSSGIKRGAERLNKTRK